MTIVDDYQGMYYDFDKTVFENNCSVVETAPVSFYAEQSMLRNVKSFARYGRFINMFVQNYEVDF